MCQVRNIPFEVQTEPSFLSICHGVYIFVEISKSFQDVIRDVYCPGKYCFSREKCESFDGYVANPRSIYGCGECGAWLFVHKVRFMFMRARKDDKSNQNTLFFAKKDKLGTQQTIVT